MNSKEEEKKQLTPKMALEMIIKLDKKNSNFDLYDF